MDRCRCIVGARCSLLAALARRTGSHAKVVELSRELGLARTVVSYELSVLAAAGVLEREGYTYVVPPDFSERLRRLLHREAERLWERVTGSEAAQA